MTQTQRLQPDRPNTPRPSRSGAGRVATLALSLATLCGCAGLTGDRAAAPDPGPEAVGALDRVPFLPANPASVRPRLNDPKPFNPDLRELRRRDIAPLYYEDMTVQYLLEFLPRGFQQRWLRRRDRWNEPAQEEMGQWEGKGVALQAYATSVRPTGGELVLKLAEFPDDTPNKTVVATITRPFLALHPGWTLSRFRRLAADRARFRVSGWLLYENTAAAEVGRQRGTLWEVHPVTKIEVWDGRDWWEPG